MYEHERREQATYPEAGRAFNTTMPPVDDALRAMFTAYLRDRNLDPELAWHNGWYPSHRAGDDIPRVVIPATSAVRGNTFWQARAMVEADKRYQSPHAPRADAVVFVRPRGRAVASVVVEGPMCALAAAMLDHSAVAIMGVTPPRESLALTALLLRGTMCTVIADSDASSAMSRVFSTLVNLGLPCQMRMPYPYKDLAAASPEQRSQLLGLSLSG